MDSNMQISYFQEFSFLCLKTHWFSSMTVYQREMTNWSSVFQWFCKCCWSHNLETNQSNSFKKYLKIKEVIQDYEHKNILNSPPTATLSP